MIFLHLLMEKPCGVCSIITSGRNSIVHVLLWCLPSSLSSLFSPSTVSVCCHLIFLSFLLAGYEGDKRRNINHVNQWLYRCRAQFHIITEIDYIVGKLSGGIKLLIALYDNGRFKKEKLSWTYKINVSKVQHYYHKIHWRGSKIFVWCEACELSLRSDIKPQH